MASRQHQAHHPTALSRTTLTDTDLEYCPKCGNIVPTLNEYTGWCSWCSPTKTTTAQQTNLANFEEFLTKHADEIEELIIQGFTFNQACKRIAQTGSKPRCVVCGRTIYRGRPNSIFCRRNLTCRHYSRRYVHLYTSKGLTKSEALSQIFSELGS